MNSKGFSIGSMMIGMPPQGGHVFSFTNSIHFDGVNDYLTTASGGSPAISANEFNPFNQTDWSFSTFSKSGGGVAFAINSAFFASLHAVGAGSRTRLILINAGSGGRKMQIQSNIYTVTSSIIIPESEQIDWRHYGCSVEIISSSVQRARFYYDGALIETKDFTNAVLTHASASLILGAASTSGTYSLSGYLAEINFMENLATDGQMADAYNGGRGANGEDVFTTVKKRLVVTNSDGQTTGDITDAIAGENLLMNGFLSPYGVTTDVPA
jgi:hypothetical protein